MDYKKTIEECISSKNPKMSLSLLLSGMVVEVGKEAVREAIIYHELNRFGFYLSKEEATLFEAIEEINRIDDDFFKLRHYLNKLDNKIISAIEIHHLEKITSSEFKRIWNEGTLYN